MERTARPLVVIGAFSASLVVGLVLMLWVMGGLRHVTAPAAIGGPFQLTDQTGQTVTDKSMQGRPSLIFFGFTHCPDVCPTTLFEISEVLKAMGTDADRVNAYYISVDPERDTQAAMKEYLSSFDPRLKGLTGNAEEIAGQPVRMSGSGSTLFTLFDDRQAAHDAAREIERGLRKVAAKVAAGAYGLAGAVDDGVEEKAAAR